MVTQAAAKMTKHKNQQTPLPKRIIIFGTFILFFAVMVYAMVYSYLPQLVKSFHIPEPEVGAYAATIASSMYLSQMCASFLWGMLADWKGSKLTIMISATYCALTTLVFGFSTTYKWALISRTMQGTSLGAFAATKALVSSCCDDSNIAFAFTIVCSSYSLGYIAGPCLSGILAFPHQQFPILFSGDTLLKRFPILLPNMVVTIGLLSTVLCGIFCLPRIQPRKSEEEQLLQESTGSNINVNIDNTVKKTLREQLKSTRFVHAMSNKWLLLCSLSYCLYGIIFLGFLELFPLYAATSVEYKGFAFTPSKIGLVLAILTVPKFIIQITILPKLITKYGAKQMYLLAFVVTAIFLPFLPAIGMIRNKTLFWVLTNVYLLIIRLCGGVAILGVNILVNNSVPAHQVGTANGLAASFSSLGFFLGASMAGTVYSWSLTNIKGIPKNKRPLGFPFNQYFTFILLSLFSILNGIIIALLPEKLNKRYESLSKAELNDDMAAKKR